ncbi:hypothetical protein E4T39_03932 [Aureobasidium subglaciale]|nr:hypothetical protein E4T39_03932 [Aureobasidium subglaciale]
MSNVPSQLPGDLGEHDPRREAHPQGNIPHSGGHEVRIGSTEQKGLNDEATAAKHSHNSDPRTDNTAEHALEGGSVESMDRQKRQHNSIIPGGRTGHDGVEDHLTRAGHEQGSHGSNAGLTGNHGSGLTGNHGSGLTGNHNSTSGLTGSGLTGSSTHHHGSTGSGLTSGLSQSGTEPISGARGTGVGGAPYDAGNLQSSGFSGSDPQERHQLHHGTAHHAHDFSHEHNTRTGALLDPASGRDTGIPGYAGGATTGTGLTGSSHTGTGLTGSSHTGTGLTGSSHTGTGLTGSHTGTGLTGSSHTGTGLTGSSHTGSEGLVREGERAVHTGTHGSTGSGLTGTHGSTGSGLGSSTTGAGYGQTGTTGHETTGERLRDDVREGEHATGHNTTDTTTTTHKKPSLLDKLNPLKDADGDGKKGFMK